MWKLAAILLIVVVGIVFAVRLTRTRVNTWDLVNDPPAPGPLVCFGDSLVAGIGADSPESSYPSQLGKLLETETVVFGKPGRTSEEGLRFVREKMSVSDGLVIVTLGGNDILRQVPKERTRECLSQIFAELQQRGALVAFTGVEGPLSGGRGRMHRELCKEHGVILVPDVLAGILSTRSLKADHIHPNAKGYRLMAERVAQAVKPHLASSVGGRR